MMIVISEKWVRSTISESTHVDSHFDIEISIDTPIFTPTVFNNIVSTSCIVTNSKNGVVDIFRQGRALWVGENTTLVVYEFISNFISNRDWSNSSKMIDQFFFVLECNIIRFLNLDSSLRLIKLTGVISALIRVLTFSY